MVKSTHLLPLLSFFFMNLQVMHMNKFLALLLVAVVVGISTTSVSAAFFPGDFFSFPSIKPFPTKTPKPTSNPSANPSSTPTPTPTPSASPITTLELLDIDPSSANFMDEFTLYGTAFGSNPGSVNFRASNQSFSSGGAPIVSWSDTEIKARVPAVKKGYYYLQVITADSKKSNELRFTVKNGQPIVNATSVRLTNGDYELTFQGTEFGLRRGSIDIYAGQDLAGNGIIEYWSSSKIRFTIPENLPHQEYGFQVTTSDGRKSSFKFFTVGN